MRDLLRPHICCDVAEIQGHSFRADLPAAMANCPCLANNEEIKSWRRWNDDSLIPYTRLQYNVLRAIFGKKRNYVHIPVNFPIVLVRKTNSHEH